jgi:lipoic acid synthetase
MAAPLPLVQITPSRSRSGLDPAPAQRKPPWLKVKSPGGATFNDVRGLLKDLKLNTVCEEAHCPNIGECWDHRAATFMIMGDTCTRNCAYCAVAHGTPQPLDTDEPRRLAEAVAKMQMRHIVVTSVDRDDLPNCGAEQFAGVVEQTRIQSPGTTIELLIPDFKGMANALKIVVDARPDILNHNLETVSRLYRIARPGGRYERALELLGRIKQLDPGMMSKSGIMVGLGEQWDELLGAIRDLRAVGCDILTLGQYLRPSATHLPVARFYSPDEFGQLKDYAESLGFRHVLSGPLVRSSYHAWEQAERSGVAAS